MTADTTIRAADEAWAFQDPAAAEGAMRRATLICAAEGWPDPHDARRIAEFWVATGRLSEADEIWDQVLSDEPRLTHRQAVVAFVGRAILSELRGERELALTKLGQASRLGRPPSF